MTENSERNHQPISLSTEQLAKIADLVVAKLTGQNAVNMSSK